MDNNARYVDADRLFAALEEFQVSASVSTEILQLLGHTDLEAGAKDQAQTSFAGALVAAAFADFCAFLLRSLDTDLET